MAVRTKVDTRLRVLIWQQYLQDQPPEPAYHRWVVSIAKQNEIPERDVRRVITEESESLQYQLNAATATVTQRLARKWGLTQERAFRVMDGLLRANRSELMKGEKGITLMGENGKPKVFTQPDWQNRAKGLDIMSDWLGMAAPQQSQVTVTQIDATDKPTPEVQQRIREILQKYVDGGGDSRIIDVGGRVAGEAVPAEPLGLDVARDQNER